MLLSFELGAARLSRDEDSFLLTLSAPHAQQYPYGFSYKALIPTLDKCLITGAQFLDPRKGADNHSFPIQSSDTYF